MSDWYIAANVAITEIGIDAAMIAVLRPSFRNTKSTSVASSPPRIAAIRTLFTLWLMNCAWSNTTEVSAPLG